MPSIKTVSQVSDLISKLIFSYTLFRKVDVKGQISSLSSSLNGHIYFNLIDEQSSISCAFFKNQNYNNDIPLEEGKSVIVSGSVRLYKKGGYHQIVVNQLSETSESLMRKKYLELRKKLSDKNYFAPERKRPLPHKISKIGLISSKRGDGNKDFLSILSKRNPFVKILFIDVSVQGENCPKEVSAAIKTFQKYDDIDLIVVTRGGGSNEDLFAFNDELICDAAFNSRIPILSAIGHEPDVSLLDETADITALTPSHAAQLLSDRVFVLINNLPNYYTRLLNSVKIKLAFSKNNLNNNIRRLKNQITSMVNSEKHILENSKKNMNIKIEHRMNEAKYILESQKKLLNSYNVENVLNRGYAIVKKNNKVLINKNEIKIDDCVNIQMSGFEITAKVEKIK